LFEALCEKFGVTIIITNSKEDVSEEAEMAPRFAGTHR
jgi:hypothetical protein